MDYVCGVVAEHDTVTHIESDARLREELVSVRAERDEFKAQLELLRAEVERLKALLGQNSSNSHRPPSSDPPGAPKGSRKKKASKLKRGAQPGHKGRARQMLPVEEVAEIVVCRPSCCGGCGAALTGDDPCPERHQVTEIPPVVATVVEYQLHQLACGGCGTSTRGALPDGVPLGVLGPKLLALIVMLSAVYRLSKRNVVQLMADYLRVRISVGTVSKAEKTASRALQVPVDEARQLAREQPTAHADETGWRQSNKKAWLWTVVTNVAVVFAIRFSRGAKVAKEMLGERFEGVLITDRWSAYRWVDLLRRQLCWAHLIRDFQKLADSRGPAVPIGEALGECARELFHLWHQVRDGTLARAEFQLQVARQIRPEVQRLLALGAGLAPGSARRGMCEALLAVETAMWTFVTTEGIEPTNNWAERIIRHGVLWRRTSFGTQSPAGSLYVERMLTTVATLRLLGRSPLDYLTEAIDAANRRLPAPSLINKA